MNRRQQSEALHDRVLRFALAARGDGHIEDEFDQLARDIAAFQNPSQPELKPTVVELFRARDVFAFEPNEAVACFETSGTTGQQSGRHYFRTTQTYERLSVLWGRKALLSRTTERMHVVALMPDPAPEFRSSLAFMCERFLRTFDTRSEDAHLPSRWLLGSAGVDVTALRAHVEHAWKQETPILLLATSFSLVMLLDALAAEQLELPSGSVVMQTGGFKGRTREIQSDELLAQIEQSLSPSAVVSEYGMTELSSQLYEGTLPQGDLRAQRGVYLPPPWLRPLVLDPATLQPIDGESPGLAAFIDLANVDSAVYIVTQDLARLEDGGIRLLGRRPRTALRGCSLAAEAIWAKASEPVSTPHDPPRSPNNSAANKPHDVAHATANVDGERRVWRLVEAARRIADTTDELGVRARRRLLEVTGLSPAAIDLGISNSLEVDPSPEEVQRLCARASKAPKTWVVLSANVFVGAHRAIAYALASSPRVLVRPSRRDPVLAELLNEADPELFELTVELAPQPGEQVHAYGSDESMRRIAEELQEDVTLLAHGSGVGAGVVFPGADLEAAAKGFSLDAVVFEQRGCLSPRVIGVHASCDVERFVAVLEAGLERWAQRVPPPERTLDERAEWAWYQELAQQVGTLRRCAHGSVLSLSRSQRLIIPPEGRNLVVFTSPDPLAQMVELRALLTSVGVAGSQSDVSRAKQLLPTARVALPGSMQAPPFDGPVDLRW